MTDRLRVLGLVEQSVLFKDGVVEGKDIKIYNALQPPFQVVGMQQATLRSFQLYYDLIRYFRPNRSRWRIQSHLNPWAYRTRSQIAERLIAPLDGQYDLIFQTQNLFSPDMHRRGRRFVLFTDNTYELSLRCYPDWVPRQSDARHRRYIELETEPYHQAAMIYTWAEQARQSLIKDYGVSPDKVIATGVGPGFKLDHRPPRRDYSTQTVIFVGREFERKGGLVLLKAWEQVRRALPGARLLLVGPRSMPDLLPAGVEFIGFINDKPRLQELYSRASLFVLPSLFEPWGHVVVEAMSMGLPVITTDRVGAADFITQGEHGMIVPAGEDEPLAQAMITLLRDADYAREVGQRAYTQVCDQLTWEHVYRRMAPSLVAAAGYMAEPTQPSRGERLHEFSGD